MLIAISGLALVVRYQAVVAEASAASDVYQHWHDEAADAYAMYDSAPPEDRSATLTAFQAAENKALAAYEVSAKAEQRGYAAEYLIYVFIVAAVLVVILSIVGALLYLAESKRSFDAQRLLGGIEEQARQRGREAVGPEGDPLELKALWVENRTRIEGYHSLVTSYASSTRRLTRTALAVGFGFLLVAGLLSLFASTPTAAVATSVVAVSGAGLAAFISSAVLRNADTSAREVQAFFSHPLNLEKYLTAERMLSDLKEPALSEARLSLIRAAFGQPEEAPPLKVD
jgi:hypothetical protein